jgi:hypothetical protein
MPTNLIVTKADFIAANLVKFSPNILDDQINPAIYSAQEYDLEPRLGADLYDDVLATVAGTITRPELLAFIDSKVKRYLVLIAYYRFISAHGLNITQFGVSKTADPQGTFNAVEASERAIILRQVQADANVALTRLTSTSFTFDGLTYAKNANGAKLGQAIRAPKRKRLSSVLGFSTRTGAGLPQNDYLLNGILNIEL